MENTSDNDNVIGCNAEVEAPPTVHVAPIEQPQTDQTQSEQPQLVTAKKKKETKWTAAW